jgi:hypothetical protein
MASDLSPVTVSIEYAGTAPQGVGPSAIKSDTSMGATYPAHVKYSPPGTSSAGLWQAYASGANAITLATLVFPVGAILDMDIEFTLRDSAVSSSSIVVAGATTGCLYMRAPDGLGYLVPVSYVSL